MEGATMLRTLSCGFAACLLATAAAAYDPLLVDEKAASQPRDLSFKDAERDRELPLRIYLPEAKEAAPVVLFSHGLGGTRGGSAFLGRHWAGRGFVVVCLQHPGSDDSLWRGKPLGERAGAMREAASAATLTARGTDVPAAIGQLARSNAADGP